MWRKRAHELVPITKICSTKVKFKWTDIENNAFIAMKKIVGRDVLLYYPNFSERSIIHTDARKTQLGGVTIKNGKSIDFYSRKLTLWKNKLYDHRKITVKYSGKIKIFTYNYFRTPYNSIYGPQEPHIWELHNRKSATLEPHIGRIRPWDKIYKRVR